MVRFAVEKIAEIVTKVFDGEKLCRKLRINSRRFGEKRSRAFLRHSGLF
jgi:hypothetical protein